MIIIINGLPESGKDTIVDLCRRLAPYPVWNLSTIDKVKIVAKDHFKWDGKKDEKARALLSEIKDAWTKYNDGPFGNVKKKVRYLVGKAFTNQMSKFLIFIHSRELKEIKKFKKELNAKALYVNRTYQYYENTGDQDATYFAPDIYDYEINNQGTLEELKNEVEIFLRWLNR